ncbi:MAG: hypothetical protein V4726_04450 [Verrucomicrobiota bacterium]
MDKVTDLFDLVGFRLGAAWLQVEDLLHAFPEINAVAPFSLAEGETGALQNQTPVREIEVRVRAAFQKAEKGFLDESLRGDPRKAFSSRACL